MTAIRPCTCTHPFQDATYGKGQRVHNKALSKERERTRWRCTVCTHEITE